MTNKLDQLDDISKRMGAFIRFILVIFTTVGAAGSAFLLVMKETEGTPELHALALNFFMFFFLLVILSSFFVIAMLILLCIEHVEIAQKARKLQFRFDVNGYTVAKIAVFGLLLIALLGYRTDVERSLRNVDVSFQCFLDKPLEVIKKSYCLSRR